MTTKPTFRTVSALLALGLVLAAAPSADAAAKKTTKKKAKATKAATTKKGAAAAATTAAAAAASPASSSGFGKKSDTLYEGAGGFKVDLSKCPKDYNPMQGITDKEIKTFVSIPKAGAFAGFGLIADGMISYFNYATSAGLVPGNRKITLDVKDDGYAADRTKANVTEALSSGKYAALVSVLGTPNNLAVWNDTNKECMPHLQNATGAPDWGDVDGHPWTTGMQLDYSSEAQLWAAWIAKDFPKGAKVAQLTYNSDFGKGYSRGFKSATKGTNISVVKEEFHEATAPNVTNQITNIMAELPDVILIQTSGAFCTQALAELEKRGNGAKVMISATCGSLSQFFQPLIDQGLTGKDAYILQYLKDVNDREFASDPFVKLFHKVLKEQGLDDSQSTYATGWVMGWYFVETLRNADSYAGGLTRPNIILGARGLDKTMPLALPGITNKMNGMTDAYLNEGARVARYRISDPKQLGTWFPQGAVINNEGKLGTFRKLMAG